jgi:hypothetical protein
MAGNYVLCEGTITHGTSGGTLHSVYCSQAWTEIPDDELGGSSNQLSAEDYEALAGLTFAVLITAFAVKMVARTILTSTRWEH